MARSEFEMLRGRIVAAFKEFDIRWNYFKSEYIKIDFKRSSDLLSLLKTL